MGQKTQADTGLTRVQQAGAKHLSRGGEGESSPNGAEEELSIPQLEENT